MTPEGRNRLLMKARRRRTAMRKMKMLSHTWVGCKVMPFSCHV
jgi:hypothetical protein